MKAAKKGAADGAAIAKSVAGSAKNAAEDQVLKAIVAMAGEGSEDSIDKVKLVLDKLLVELLPNFKARHPCLLNLAMIGNKCTSERRYDTPPGVGRPFTDGGVWKRAARYAKFAGAAYFSTEQEIADYVPGLDIKDVVFLHKATSPTKPNFFIAKDAQTNAFVLSIRGTASLSDVITDIVANKVAFMGGFAHEGILQSAGEVANRTRLLLHELGEANPSMNFVVTGHSLGAGTAVLALVRIFAEYGTASDHFRRLCAGKAKCFAFAPPPTFAPVDKLPLHVTANVYSFVNHTDCVPRACLGTAAKVLLATKTVDGLDVDGPSRLLFLKDASKYSNTEWSGQIVDSVDPEGSSRDKFGSLYGVGVLVQMYPKEDGSLAGDRVQHDALDKILFHDGMGTNHCIGAYEEAAAKLANKYANSIAASTEDAQSGDSSSFCGCCKRREPRVKDKE